MDESSKKTEQQSVSKVIKFDDNEFPPDVSEDGSVQKSCSITVEEEYFADSSCQFCALKIASMQKLLAMKNNFIAAKGLEMEFKQFSTLS